MQPVGTIQQVPYKNANIAPTNISYISQRREPSQRERFFPNGLGNFGVLAGCMSMEKISPWARHGAVLP